MSGSSGILYIIVMKHPQVARGPDVAGHPLTVNSVSHDGSTLSLQAFYTCVGICRTMKAKHVSIPGLSTSLLVSIVLVVL